MRDESRKHDKKTTCRRLPFIILAVALLVVYPFSIPFYYLIGQSLPSWLPEWVHDGYLALSHIYDPLQWLYFHADWVKAFYDWYEQFFPWWQ